MYRQPFAEKPLDMAHFDSMAQCKAMRRELDRLTDPRRRKILSNMIEHAEAEGQGRYDDLMASCSKKSQSYVFWGSGNNSITDYLPQSYEQLLGHYKGLMDSKTWMLHYELDKIIVGDDEILIDGVLHQLYPTALIEPLFGIAVDPKYRAYQMTKRLATLFLFDEDGVGCGEHAYANGPTKPEDLTPVEDRYLPDLFKAA